MIITLLSFLTFNLLSSIGNTDSVVIVSDFKFDNINQLHFDVKDSNVFIASYIQKSISILNINTGKTNSFSSSRNMAATLFNPSAIHVCNDTIFAGKDRLLVGYNFEGKRIAQYEIKVDEYDQYVPGYPFFLSYPVFRKLTGTGKVVFSIMPHYYPGESPDENAFFNKAYYEKKHLIGIVDLNNCKREENYGSCNVTFSQTMVNYDKVYVDSAFLFHYYHRFWDIDDKNKLVIISQMASPKIGIYNLKGKMIDEFGEEGRNGQSGIPLTRFTYKEYSEHTYDIGNYIRARSLVNTNYYQLFYDETTDMTIRLYKTAVPGLTAADVSFDKIAGMNDSLILKLFTERPTYLQLYKNKKLVEDIAFPADIKVIAFKDGIIWAVKKNDELLTFYRVKIK